MTELMTDPDELAAIEDLEQDDESGEETGDNSGDDSGDDTDDEEPAPGYYHDLDEGEENMGWCCQTSPGSDSGYTCGSRNINGQNKQLQVYSNTLKSDNFVSRDLSFLACMQETSVCGERKRTLPTVDDSTLLEAKGLSEDTMCSYHVKTVCGLPKVSVLDKSSSFTSSNTKIIYFEWQPSLMESVYGDDQWAPLTDLVIPNAMNFPAE